MLTSTRTPPTRITTKQALLRRYARLLPYDGAVIDGIFGNTGLGLGYTNRTQQVRMISEGWITRYGYCLRCDSDELTPTPANTRTRDFFCKVCRHGYELKSKRGLFTNKVLDGAYSAMMRTIREGNTPTFLLLEYSSTWSIQGLRAIHHSLITETSIEARKPLAASALDRLQHRFAGDSDSGTNLNRQQRHNECEASSPRSFRTA
jgi:Dam-replacing family